MKSVLKALYYVIPLKRELYTILKALWIPPKSIYKHLHFKSKFKICLEKNTCFYIGNNNSEIENDIFWEGLDNCWERMSIKLWVDLCKDANTILDVGAYTGMYSLVAECLNPNANIHCFEPSSEVYEKLAGNVRMNNYKIVYNNLGVSSKDGQVEIEGIYQDNKMVDSVALDSYIDKNNIQSLDLIKIDVEKHEPEVLLGFRNSLAKYQPTMLIESLTDDIGAQIQDFVKDYNYLYFNIDEEGGVRQQDVIRKSDYYNYLLCKKDVAEKLFLA